MYSTKMYWDAVDHKVRIQDRKAMEKWMDENYKDGQWFTLVIHPIGKENNTDQSKLYHKWCDILAGEFGWNSGSDFHEFFKIEFNNGKSTKGFDTKQWSEYMIKVSAFAGEHNINLPTGNS